MFIFLSKILPLFVYPVGLTCILLFLALANARNRRSSVAFIVLALLVLWLSSTSGVSNLLAKSLEWRYLPPAEIPNADAIVLLGGGTEPAASPRPGVELNGAGDRVLYAAHVFRQGKAPLIVLSGGEITWLNKGSTTPADEMAALLTDMGIPAEALLLEKESRNTYENALYTKKLLEERGINKILLVTSAMHMPRSVALFNAQGFEVTPLPVDFNVVDSAPQADADGALAAKLLNIIPNTGNLALTTNALKEYLGYFIYQLQGWL